MKVCVECLGDLQGPLRLTAVHSFRLLPYMVAHPQVTGSWSACLLLYFTLYTVQVHTVKSINIRAGQNLDRLHAALPVSYCSRSLRRVRPVKLNWK